MSKAASAKSTGKKGGRAGRGDGVVKVLLAEDEESFVDALVIGLNNEGFRVTVARDGPRRSSSSRRPSPTSCCST